MSVSQPIERRPVSLSTLAAAVFARLALTALKGRSETSRSSSDATARRRPEPARRQPHGKTDGQPQRKSEDHAFGEAKSTDEPKQKQHERAREPGRGREAVSPLQIPWAGWKDILWRTYEEIGKDRLLSVAAGVVFFSLLAIFPAVTAGVSSYGLFFDYSTINDHLALAAGIMPEGAFGIVRDQVARIVSKGSAQLSLGFLFGLGLALWSANAGMKAIFDALNIIYDEEEKRGFIKLNLISLTFTFGAIVAMLLAVSAVVVFPVILATFGIQKINPMLISILRWPILFALIIFGLSLIYRYGPSRKDAEWRWVTVGSVVAAVTWVAGSLGFSFYLSNFADYDATYGSLGAVIGLMMWMWLSAIVILVGAELNAEIEHQTARDSTPGGEKPIGGRGAAMADTVGEAKA
jgi:membrane protein